MAERTKVLVPIAEPIGGPMSAVGVRQFQVGRALAQVCDVTFATASDSVDESHGVPVARCRTRSEFRSLLRGHDVLYTLGLNSDRYLDAASSSIRIVLDLYTPQAFEIMECWPEVPDPVMECLYWRNVRWTIPQLVRADLVVCATEPQRDLWIGMMNAAGALSVGESRRDPAWHRRLAVVPFGVPEDEPRAEGHPLRNRLPSNSTDDFLFLWSSKILAWHDPVTLIRAMKFATERDPSIRLVFFGIGEPRSSGGSKLDNVTLPTKQTREASDDMGLTGKSVFFLNDRIPYQDLGGFLADADAAVATFPDSLETRMCLGSRLLDYLWAGLPMVVSGVELQRDFVEGQGLGRVVPPANPEALADALVLLRRDVREGSIHSPAFARARDKLRWPVVTQPLLDYCTSPEVRVERSRRGILAALPPLMEFIARSVHCKILTRLNGIS